MSGPLTLAYIKQYANRPPSAFHPAREQLRGVVAHAGTDRERRLARRTLEQTSPGSYAVGEVLLRVAAGRQVTVAVASPQRSSVALVYSKHARNQERRGAPGAYRVVDGDAAVTFRACASADTDFLGGIVVAGARCVEMTVTSPGRRPADLRLPFGKDTCARSTRVATRGQRFLRREPGLGVACAKANSIACDRVGLAIWLTRAAASVTATIDGQALRLHAGGLGGRGPTYWEGYRQPAGLLDGPLKVTPDRGRYFWQGRHPKDARLVITIERPDGSTEEASLSVPLRPGWG